MSQTCNYNFTGDDLHRIIIEWDKAKDFSNKLLKFVCDLNSELKNCVENKVPLSKNSIARQSGFQRANRMMRPYIKFLPAYLKAVDSNEITSTLSSLRVKL